MAEELITFLRGRKKANLIIVIVNIAVFIGLSILGDTYDTQFMLMHGACYVPSIRQGEIWRLVTSMFLHFGYVHLIYNMLCLIYLGDILESAVGTTWYLIIYFVGGIAGNLVSVAWESFTGNYAVSAGASGAIFAVIGACCLVALRGRGHQIAGIGAQRLCLVTVLMVAEGFTTAGTDNAAHIGGVVAGFALAALYKRQR